jgi:hypothetical protein
MPLNFGRPRVKNSNSDPVKRTADGRVFDSRHEMKMYEALKAVMSEYPGVPWWLQPAFELVPAFEMGGKKMLGMRISADFLVGPGRAHRSDPILPEHLVIDAKGMLTETFVLRRKLFYYTYRHPYHCVKKADELVSLVRNHMATYYGR